MTAVERGSAVTPHSIRRLTGVGRRVVRMLVLTIVALWCAVTASAAVGSETTSTTSEATSKSATLAKRVNIGGGRSMYIECRGKGSPTVLLISGADTASDLWHAADQKTPRVHVTNTHSGHNIMIENAPLTTKWIRKVVDAARAPKTSLIGG